MLCTYYGKNWLILATFVAKCSKVQTLAILTDSIYVNPLSNIIDYFLSPSDQSGYEPVDRQALRLRIHYLRKGT